MLGFLQGDMLKMAEPQHEKSLIFKGLCTEAPPTHYDAQPHNSPPPTTDYIDIQGEQEMNCCYAKALG